MRSPERGMDNRDLEAHATRGELSAWRFPLSGDSSYSANSGKFGYVMRLGRLGEASYSSSSGYLSSIASITDLMFFLVSTLFSICLFSLSTGRLSRVPT